MNLCFRVVWTLSAIGVGVIAMVREEWTSVMLAGLLLLLSAEVE